jgi:hypothetical protein
MAADAEDAARLVLDAARARAAGRPAP